MYPTKKTLRWPRVSAGDLDLDVHYLFHAIRATYSGRSAALTRRWRT